MDLIVAEDEAHKDGCDCNGVHSEESLRTCKLFHQALQIAKVVDPLLISLNAPSTPTESFQTPSHKCWDSYLSQFIAMGYEFCGSRLDASEYGYKRQQSHFCIIVSKIGLPYPLSTTRSGIPPY
jgi:hypothetical protein